MALHIHIDRVDSTTIQHSLYRIMVMATSVMGVMKMGSTVPKVGLEPHLWQVC